MQLPPFAHAQRAVHVRGIDNLDALVQRPLHRQPEGHPFTEHPSRLGQVQLHSFLRPGDHRIDPHPLLLDGPGIAEADIVYLCKGVSHTQAGSVNETPILQMATQTHLDPTRDIDAVAGRGYELMLDLNMRRTLRILDIPEIDSRPQPSCWLEKGDGDTGSRELFPVIRPGSVSRSPIVQADNRGDKARYSRRRWEREGDRGGCRVGFTEQGHVGRTIEHDGHLGLTSLPAPASLQPRPSFPPCL